MAHKKAGGSTRNGRDSVSKRLGVKCFGGEAVKAGNIIVRQRGTKLSPRRKCGYRQRSYAVREGRWQDRVYCSWPEKPQVCTGRERLNRWHRSQAIKGLVN